MGVGRARKEHKPGGSVVAVEPPAGELVQGLRNLDDGFVPPIFDPRVRDRKFSLRPREPVEWRRPMLAAGHAPPRSPPRAPSAGAAPRPAATPHGPGVTLRRAGARPYP